MTMTPRAFDMLSSAGSPGLSVREAAAHMPGTRLADIAAAFAVLETYGLIVLVREQGEPRAKRRPIGGRWGFPRRRGRLDRRDAVWRLSDYATPRERELRHLDEYGREREEAAYATA